MTTRLIEATEGLGLLKRNSIPDRWHCAMEFKNYHTSLWVSVFVDTSVNRGLMRGKVNIGIVFMANL